MYNKTAMKLIVIFERYNKNDNKSFIQRKASNDEEDKKICVLFSKKNKRQTGNFFREKNLHIKII